MTFYTNFGTNKALEADGVTLDYGDAGRITIARAGGANKKFGTVLQAKLKPYRRQIDTDTMDNDVATRLLAEAYAETVVKAWDGGVDDQGATKPFLGKDGQPLEFSRANVVKLFTDLPDLFKDVQAQANAVSNFRAEQTAADIGAVKNA